MLDLIVGIFVMIFGFLFKVYWFLKMAVKWMLFPFSWLKMSVQDYFEERFGGSGRLNSCFSAFAGFGPFLLFCGILAFLAYRIYAQVTAGTMATYWSEVLYSTTLGSFFEIIQQRMDITPTTLVAIAFGSFVFNACYDTLEDARIYVKIPCFVLYFIMSANLALMLTDVFAAYGNWLYNTAMALMDRTDVNIGQQFLNLLTVLPLMYVLLIMCFMTASEYLESAVFGLVGMFILRMLSALFGWILDSLDAAELAYAIVEQVALWAVVFGLEALKNPVTDLLEDSI